MDTSPVQIYEYHSTGGSIYWVGCALTFVCGATALLLPTHIDGGLWFVRALGILFIFAGLCMLIRPQTAVDSVGRIIHRQFRLFGHFLLWSRKYPFSDFVSVVIHRAGGDPPQLFVSLGRRRGRDIVVRYFEAGISLSCRPAEEFAHRLSVDLQVGIDAHHA